MAFMPGGFFRLLGTRQEAGSMLLPIDPADSG